MMENHKDISVSSLRKYIIRYGAKAMEAFESDLFYDCQAVGKMEDGDSVFWMVSEAHTYMYSVKEIVESDLSTATIAGDRFNFRIDCIKDKYGETMYSMTRVWDSEIDYAVIEYRNKSKG